MLCKKKMVLCLFGAAMLGATIAATSGPHYPTIRASYYKTVLRDSDTLEVQDKGQALYCAVKRNERTGNLSYLGRVDATLRGQGENGAKSEQHLSSVFGPDVVMDPVLSGLHRGCLNGMDRYNRGNTNG